MNTTEPLAQSNPFLAEIDEDYFGSSFAETLDNLRYWQGILTALAYDNKFFFDGSHRREFFSNPEFAAIDRENEAYERMAEVLRYGGSNELLSQAIEALSFVTSKFTKEN
jgi:hypothetical protein